MAPWSGGDASILPGSGKLWAASIKSMARMEAIRTNIVETAIVGGVNLLLSLFSFVCFLVDFGSHDRALGHRQRAPINNDPNS